MTETTTAITGARLIDGLGGEPVDGVTILVTGDTITAVGADQEAPAGAEVIDAAGGTVLPGLIDAHLHLFGIAGYDFAQWAMEPPHLHAIRSAVEVRRILEAGYTMIRDCGSDHALYIKRAVEEGSIEGPRIRAVGRFMCETGGIPDLPFMPLDAMSEPHSPGFARLADGVDGALRAAREQLREGATDLKIGVTGGIDPSFIVAESAWTLDEIRAFAHVAHNVGKKLSAHSNTLLGESCIGMQRAIEGGVDSIEHGYWVDDKTLEMMVEHGVVWNPTIGYLQRAVDRGEELGLHPVYIEKCGRAIESIADTMGRAKAMGVKRAMGSDFLGTPADPHGEEAFELEMQVRCGLSEMEAIVTATRHNAEFFAVDDRQGTVEAGKAADLLLVSGDPLADIRVLQQSDNIKLVMLDGQIKVRRA